MVKTLFTSNFKIVKTSDLHPFKILAQLGNLGGLFILFLDNELRKRYESGPLVLIIYRPSAVYLRIEALKTPYFRNTLFPRVFLTKIFSLKFSLCVEL
jgi:hypothetical protein